MSNKVIKSSSDSIWSEYSDDQKLLEWHLIEFLPLKRKFLILWSKLVVPILESVWSFFFKLLNEVFETFNFIQFLETVPGKIW